MPEESFSEQHLWVRDIQVDQRVSGCYLVKGKRLSKTRTGNPFLSLTLADKSGELPAKIWNNAESLSALFREGEVIEIEGKATAYQGRTQLTVSGLRPLAEPPDSSLFVETSPFDASKMTRTLRKTLNAVQDVHLRALIDRFWGDRDFMALFKKAPAAKNFHHGYQGGLLEHTLSVSQLCAQVADHYPVLNREMLLTAAFLHDLGKTRELVGDLRIDYSHEGRLVGHVVLSVIMMDEKLNTIKAFPEELALRLRHMILSHHGQYDFGSPKAPKFLEAFALHLVDDLDAKINGIQYFMQKDGQEGAWTDFHRLFGRYFLKGPIGPSMQRDGAEKGEAPPAVEQGFLFTPKPKGPGPQ